MGIWLIGWIKSSPLQECIRCLRWRNDYGPGCMQFFIFHIQNRKNCFLHMHCMNAVFIRMEPQTGLAICRCMWLWPGFSHRLGKNCPFRYVKICRLLISWKSIWKILRRRTGKEFIFKMNIGNPCRKHTRCITRRWSGIFICWSMELDIPVLRMIWHLSCSMWLRLQNGIIRVIRSREWSLCVIRGSVLPVF